MATTNEKLCRICLLTDLNKLVNMFNDNIDSLYSSITQLSISRNDMFPKYICYQCYDQLMNWEEFKKKAEDSLSTYLTEKHPTGSLDASLVTATKSKSAGELISINKVHEEFKPKQAAPEQKQQSQSQNTRVNPWEVGHPCERCFLPFDRFEFFKNAPKVQKKPITVKKMRIFRCSKCNQAYNSRQMLEDHEEQHHEQFLMQCAPPVEVIDDDPDGFDYMTDLTVESPPQRKEKEKEKEKGSLQCDICPFKFETLRALGVHKSFHRRRGETGAVASTVEAKQEALDLNDKLFTCKKCFKKFFTNHGLLIHAKRAHKRKRRSSDSSPDRNPQKIPKTPIVIEDNSGKPEIYNCLIPGCSKSFLTRHGLSMHAKYHKKRLDATEASLEIVDLETVEKEPEIEAEPEVEVNQPEIELIPIPKKAPEIPVKQLLECDWCHSKSFDSKRGLAMHKTHHRRNGEYQEKALEEIQMPEVEEELPTVPEEQQPVPEESFDAAESPKTSADEEEKFSCETCNKVFETRRLLSIHKFRIHEIPTLLSNNTSENPGEPNGDDAGEAVEEPLGVES